MKPRRLPVFSETAKVPIAWARSQRSAGASLEQQYILSFIRHREKRCHPPRVRIGQRISLAVSAPPPFHTLHRAGRSSRFDPAIAARRISAVMFHSPATRRSHSVITIALPFALRVRSSLASANHRSDGSLAPCRGNIGFVHTYRPSSTTRMIRRCVRTAHGVKIGAFISGIILAIVVCSSMT